MADNNFDMNFTKAQLDLIKKLSQYKVIIHSNGIYYGNVMVLSFAGFRLRGLRGGANDYGIDFTGSFIAIYDNTSQPGKTCVMSVKKDGKSGYIRFN